MTFVLFLPFTTTTVLPYVYILLYITILYLSHSLAIEATKMSDDLGSFAVDSSLCFVCKVSFDIDRSRKIQCNLCNLWGHTICLKIDEDLMSAIEIMCRRGRGHFWNCDSCSQFGIKLAKDLSEAKQRIGEVEKQLVEVREKVDVVVEDVEVLRERVVGVEKASGRDHTKEVLNELDERDLKQCNIIVHKMREASRSVTELEQRRKHDMELILEIFMAIGSGHVVEEINFLKRLGAPKQDGTPRSLIVGFSELKFKNDALDCAKNLRNTIYSNVVIGPDLTDRQRDKNAELRVEAERRNANLTSEQQSKNLQWRVVTRSRQKVLALLPNRAHAPVRTGSNADPIGNKRPDQPPPQQRGRRGNTTSASTTPRQGTTRTRSMGGPDSESPDASGSKRHRPSVVDDHSDGVHENMEN